MVTLAQAPLRSECLLTCHHGDSFLGSLYTVLSSCVSPTPPGPCAAPQLLPHASSWPRTTSCPHVALPLQRTLSCAHSLRFQRKPQLPFRQTESSGTNCHLRRSCFLCWLLTCVHELFHLAGFQCPRLWRGLRTQCSSHENAPQN